MASALGFRQGGSGALTHCHSVPTAILSAFTNMGDPASIPGSGRFPCREAWQPTPVFLPGEPHGQRSLAGHSPGVAESDATERLSRSTEQALGRSESCCGASQLTPDSADGRSKAQRGCVAALGLRSWHVEDRSLETLLLLTRVMCLLYQAA